ncbi:putative HVA22-like protein g [Salvia hispanica]|uniref:putative HVA22-like protein g n=1 Tax=Salvia hispanica TaxID=49212 RepID=UPI002009249A|nr:putative HVA22-like protein g [Salvia hispanica]
MIGEFVTSCLILVLGYAYPAFQCFKTVEKNRVEIPELRFWCQYWILVAIITILERIGDVFISWLPMYGEMKLALFIYLWYPKTNGSGYIYDRLLRPYVSRHETDIDRSLIEFRERAWNLAIYYWHNCTELGSTKILQFLQFVSSRSTQNPGNQQQRVNTTPEPSAPRVGFMNSQPPSHFSQAPRSENGTHLVRPEDVIVCDSNCVGAFNSNEKLGLEKDVSTAKHRLRRFIDGN